MQTCERINSSINLVSHKLITIKQFEIYRAWNNKTTAISVAVLNAEQCPLIQQ